MVLHIIEVYEGKIYIQELLVINYSDLLTSLLF
jgi:hypothetical protein